MDSVDEKTHVFRPLVDPPHVVVFPVSGRRDINRCASNGKLVSLSVVGNVSGKDCLVHVDVAYGG